MMGRDSLDKRTVLEKQRLREEHLFFEKKLEILQDGFRNLEEERKRFETEKRMLEEEIARLREKTRDMQKQERTQNTSASIGDNVAEVLFRNVNNPLALRKRYRDLIKIFHPDNLFGDEELVQQINKEFVKRKNRE